jgi:predicted transcriptional regulator
MTSLKKFIASIASAKAPGPSMTSGPAHIFFALELIAVKPIGRNQLAKKLAVGEGSVRTLITRLKNNELIETSRSGCSLTDKGYMIWTKFVQLFPKRGEIGKTELTNAKQNYAFLVKGNGRKVKSGIEQRDAAIVAGATGAVIIVSKLGHLTIQSVSSRLERKFPEAARQIKETFEPKDDDAVVLVGADSISKAKQGAFAASWTLIGLDEQVPLD